MGKIGVISDVHGNLQALKAILAYFDGEKCDEIIHTGDVVDIGPNSRECLELMLSRTDVTMLLGNHDRDFLLNQSEARYMSHVPTEHKRHVFATLNASHREAVSKFPVHVTCTVGSKKLVFVHYALNDGPIRDINFLFKTITQRPTAEKLDELFENVDCDAVFFGHKHEPCDIIGRKLYVDVGSVGCHPRPFARGVIIDYDDENFTYRRVEAPYDMEQVRRSLEHVPCGNQLYDFYFLLSCVRGQN